MILISYVSSARQTIRIYISCKSSARQTIRLDISCESTAGQKTRPDISCELPARQTILICVEVLLSSQPIVVMLSVVTLPNHNFSWAGDNPHETILIFFKTCNKISLISSTTILKGTVRRNNTLSGEAILSKPVCFPSEKGSILKKRICSKKETIMRSS